MFLYLAFYCHNFVNNGATKNKRNYLETKNKSKLKKNYKLHDVSGILGYILFDMKKPIVIKIDHVFETLT